MNPRDKIISRLPQAQSDGPDLPERVRSYPDLAAQFAARLEASKGEVHRAASLETAFETLGQLFVQLQVKSVVADHLPGDGHEFLADAFPQQEWHFAGEAQDFREIAARVNAGITGAEYALAETGSLVIAPGPDQSRLTSLLPPLHFVLLPQSRILPSIFDWVELLPDRLPSNLVLVSGPSKTADIEQTLVTGVHGPKRLIVIVYPDVA